jgi:hypothetical protein
MTYLLSTGSLQLQPSSGWSLRATRCGFIACSPNSVTNCASAMLSPFASRRQKNDRRDAELLLDLLLHDDFPAVHVPAPASREVLALLRYRHRLVRLRTHPGVGLLTALAVVHTLEPVSRFRQARCVWVSGRRSANAVIIQNETFSPRARHLHRVSF